MAATSLTDKLTAIGDAVRAKTGTVDKLTLDQMTSAIAGIQSNGIRVNTVGEGDHVLGYYTDAACTVPLTESSLYALLPDGDVYKKVIKLVPWATGSDSDVAEFIAKAQAGIINLADYWSVGDTRKVQLSAMDATGVGESHVAQEVEIVLMDFRQLYDYTDGTGKCKVIWGLKDCLLEHGCLNETRGGVYEAWGWTLCARSTWCDEVFFEALPTWMQDVTKAIDISFSEAYCYRGGSKPASSSNIISARCFIPATSTGFTWYATSENRIKRTGPNGSLCNWWLSEIYKSSNTYYSHFNYQTTSSGTTAHDKQNTRYGISPCGCF